MPLNYVKKNNVIGDTPTDDWLAGNKSPNITNTHNEECNGLWVDVKEVVVLAIPQVVTCTYEEIQCHAKLRKKNPDKKR